MAKRTETDAKAMQIQNLKKEINELNLKIAELEAANAILRCKIDRIVSAIMKKFGEMDYGKNFFSNFMNWFRAFSVVKEIIEIIKNPCENEA